MGTALLFVSLAKRYKTICQLEHTNHKGHTRICTLELATYKEVLVLCVPGGSCCNGWNRSGNDRFAAKELQS